MRILFLGNSNDELKLAGDAPLRNQLMREALSEEFGEVEVIMKRTWPDAALPVALEKWLKTLEPDVVYINVTEFWCLHESIPLRIERTFGRVGRPIARAALKAAASPTIGHNRVFRGIRTAAQAVIRGDPQFTPQQVTARVTECARICLRREGTVVVVDGQRGRWPLSITRRGRDRIERRRQEVHRGLTEACARLHVVYESDDIPQWKANAALRKQAHSDGFHHGAAAQVLMANESAALIRRAWYESERLQTN